MSDQTTTPQAALRAAVDAVGSQAALARLLGLSQPSVWKWIKKDSPLPAEYVLTVELATGIPKEHLRPDIYPVAELPTSSDLEPTR